MGFRFGFSIDIYAKIQNFKSKAAIVFMVIMLFSVKNTGLSHINKKTQILI